MSEKRIKVDSNLFKRGEAYHYRKGSTEVSLGKFPNDKKAIEAKIAFEQLRSRVGVEAVDFRVKDLWPVYFAEREEQLQPIPGRKNISDRTLYEIRGIWEKHLKRFFANRRLSDVDDPLWNDYCRRASVADLTNHRKVLGYFLRWCKINGKIRFLPEMQIPPVKRRRRKLVRPEHVRLMLQCSEGSLLLFVATYLFMGVRRSEQMNCEWRFINFDENWMLIPDESTRTRRGRVIPLNAYVKELLLARKRQVGSRFVFPKRGDSNSPMTKDGLNKAWQNMIGRSGLGSVGYEPHDLRATFEHYASKSIIHTDTQREKMVGASMSIQKKIYLHGYTADDLRGLESVVDIDGMNEILKLKISGPMGKTRESQKTGTPKKGVDKSNLAVKSSSIGENK